MSYQVGAYDPNYYARRRRNFMYAAAGSAARYYAPRAASYMGSVAMDYGRRAAGYAANTLSSYIQSRRKSSEAVVGSKRLRTNAKSDTQTTQEFPDNPSRAVEPVQVWAPPSGNPRMYMKRRLRPMLKQNQSIKKADILMDIVCPPCEENYRETGTQLDWIANQQGTAEYVHLSRSKVDQLITKSQDVCNIAFNVTPAAPSRRFKYTGGKQIHTFINTCTHHVTLHLYEYKCISNCSAGPLEAWANDLTRDNTLSNAQAPIDVAQTVSTTRNFPKSRHLQLYRDWKNLKRVKFEIPPGEKAEYIMYHPAFEFDDRDIAPLVGATESASLDKRYTKALLAIAQGVEVVDSTSTSVTTGSGHLAHMMEEFNYFRAQPPTKFVNRFASGSFGDIALQASEQAINMETDAQDGAYAEDV